MTQYLAVIGAGPKGAAIAAKAAALRAAGFTAPHVVLFEPNATAAAWSGQQGYTDGEQELCTLAERDVGYPYDRGAYSAHPNVPELTFATFSWHQFAVSAGIDETQYDRWVVRGRRPPAHRDFARYLEFVIGRSGAIVVNAAVTEISFNAATHDWIVETARGPYSELFVGVVVTGSGVPFAPLPNANTRVFDGKSFWQNLSRVTYLLQAALPEDRAVVIIGGGGTAAAVANWFLRKNIRDIPIHVIGHEATLYARWPTFFEDRLFTEIGEWRSLAPHTQDAFVARLTRGVVWASALNNLNQARNLTYQARTARGFRALGAAGPRGLPADLLLELDYPPIPGQPPSPPSGAPAGLLEATVYVDARGFDPWWFARSLLSPGNPLRQRFASATDRANAVDTIDQYLAISGSISPGNRFPPGLHVPMLASRRGPASPNLMALGWMSDQILWPYVTP